MVKRLFVVWVVLSAVFVGALAARAGDTDKKAAHDKVHGDDGPKVEIILRDEGDGRIILKRRHGDDASDEAVILDLEGVQETLARALEEAVEAIEDIDIDATIELSEEALVELEDAQAEALAALEESYEDLSEEARRAVEKIRKRIKVIKTGDGAVVILGGGDGDTPRTYAFDSKEGGKRTVIVIEDGKVEIVTSDKDD